jgi:hypothetical protein
MMPAVRRSLCTALFAMGALVVLVVMYIPIVRVHQGWEDEIFWFSTCLSMLRHLRPVPSVLEDFPGTRSPLHFYGPTLFWAGALTMKIFGATVRSWRSFGFAGNVAFLAAIALLFRRLWRSWCAAMIAVFVFSLSLWSSLGFSVPGRLDAWTLALIVLALAFVAREYADLPQTMAAFVVRWLSFGALLGVAASTTPRCWPLLFFLLATSPLLVEKHRMRSLLIAVLGCLGTLALLLLPLHSTPWGHLAYVRQASSNDKVNISPLLGGSWGFGHSATQIVYYGAVLVILALLFLPRWSETERFGKWLLCAGLLNLAAMVLLVSRAVNTPTYWAFPLEIAAMMGLTRFAQGGSARFARMLGILLLVYMAALRTARGLPVFMHWTQRDPAPVAQSIANAIPSGSLVYGPVGQYFYPTSESGSDYRYLMERTTPGLSSVPDRIDTQTPMRDACHRAAYLVWPTEKSAEPLPILPHATLSRTADHPAPQQSSGRLEQVVEKVPGGRSETEDEGFAVYRLQMDPQYCEQPFRSLTSQDYPR